MKKKNKGNARRMIAEGCLGRERNDEFSEIGRWTGHL